MLGAVVALTALGSPVMTDSVPATRCALDVAGELDGPVAVAIATVSLDRKVAEGLTDGETSEGLTDGETSEGRCRAAPGSTDAGDELLDQDGTADLPAAEEAADSEGDRAHGTDEPPESTSDPAVPTDPDPAVPTDSGPAVHTDPDPAVPTDSGPAVPTDSDPAAPTTDDERRDRREGVDESTDETGDGAGGGAPGPRVNHAPVISLDDVQERVHDRAAIDPLLGVGAHDPEDGDLTAHLAYTLVDGEDSTVTVTYTVTDSDGARAEAVRTYTIIQAETDPAEEAEPAGAESIISPSLTAGTSALEAPARHSAAAVAAPSLAPARPGAARALPAPAPQSAQSGTAHTGTDLRVAQTPRESANTSAISVGEDPPAGVPPEAADLTVSLPLLMIAAAVGAGWMFRGLRLL